MHLEPLSQPSKTAGTTVDAKEARLAAVALAEQNALLKQQAEDLETQVHHLTESLASVRAEADAFKARLEQAELDMGNVPVSDAVLPRENLAVVDANPSLRMVVLDAGTANGIRPGMAFEVVRDRSVIAEMRVVDVRRRVCGAVVEELGGSGFPGRGDRVIARKQSDR